ncbi:MAG TPA: glycoside hydrolase family 65 [Bacillota bacterium]
MTIDRYQLVSRHNPVLKKLDPRSPLSIGNGELAFTADITGMQTFPEPYRDNMPLCTQSQWGWHTAPADDGRYFTHHDLSLQYFDVAGRRVGYAVSNEGQEEIYDWLRLNPHRLHLGRIGLEMLTSDGNLAWPDDIQNIYQQLDLWRGILESRFTLGGVPVNVKTCCHPTQGILAFSVVSELLPRGRLKVRLAFPYGSPDKTAADWSSDQKHNTVMIPMDGVDFGLMRILDHNRYFVGIRHSNTGRLYRDGRNEFVMEPATGVSKLEFSVSFTPKPLFEALPSFADIQAACEKHWKKFWLEGGAVTLAGSRDPQANELERRIILSQYLTAIQCTGTMPPQETGLTCNSWYGKFHLEMHWWHAAHFPLWGRSRLLERSIWWYRTILPLAKGIAASQGYRGARWPKMVGPAGYDSPSPIGPLLIWQQPHPIYLAELCYRAHPSPGTLEIYRDIVLETAEFMASYVQYDETNNRYVLGPPVIPAQENHRPETTLNPTFELEYWCFGLNTANQWRKRLGLDENETWREIASRLSALPVMDGFYLAHENCPATFSRFNLDHPSMLGALGVLPGMKVDRGTMMKTLYKVLQEWRLEEMWGWDFPMIAMTAARVGRPDIAVAALLMDSPKNRYLPNGHNCQGERKDLPLYLPGNGGLLTAVAMMAAGWDGCEFGDTPGFPKDGNWTVTWEGLLPMP